MIERFDPTAERANHAHRVFRQEHVRRYLLAAEAISEARNGSKREPCIIDAAAGCGYGWRYLSLLGNYVGLECDLDALETARDDYPDGTFLRCDLEAEGFSGLPCPVDVIVSLETAEHLRDPEAFLARAFRALALRQGRLIFSVPTSLTRDFDPYHRHDWSAERWRAALRRAGFMVLREVPMPFDVPIREFLGAVPTTWRQRARVAWFWMLHPRYLAARFWQWLVLRRFLWESTLFVCAARVN